MSLGKVVMGLVAASLLLVPSVALAGPIVHSDSVTFTSDLEADKTINLPKFDTVGGTLTLTGVTVALYHSGSADISGDNDDADEGCQVNARIIRAWAVAGPDVAGNGTNTVASGIVSLVKDNGDLDAFDPTTPDGTDFGTLSYSDLLAGTFTPSLAGYAADGGGTVSFIIDVLSIVNDQQFTGPAPDAWQLEVENPFLEVEAVVTYTYVPEPVTMSLLGIGLAGLAVRRRR